MPSSQEREQSHCQPARCFCRLIDSNEGFAAAHAIRGWEMVARACAQIINLPRDDESWAGECILHRCPASF